MKDENFDKNVIHASNDDFREMFSLIDKDSSGTIGQ